MELQRMWMPALVKYINQNITQDQISPELGFYNASYFGKFFKKIRASHPQEYKLNNK